MKNKKLILSVVFILLFSSLSAQEVIFKETFNEVNGSESGSDDVNGVSWTSNCDGCESGDVWFVNDGRFENNDSNGPATWSTSPIDVSGCSQFEITFDIIQDGDFEGCGTGCNSVDWVNLRYRIDGGGTQNPGNAYYCSGDCADLSVIADGNISGGEMAYSSGCINGGNFLQIEIGTQTWSGSEFISIDNVTVTCCCEKPNLQLYPPPAVCAPNSIDLTDSSITAGSDPGTLSYWRDDQATISLSNPDSITSSGTYYISLAAGSCSSIQPINIIVKPLPLANAGANRGYCPNEQLKLGGNPTSTSGSSYWWSTIIPDSLIILPEENRSEANPSIIVEDSADGSATFNVMVTNNGCVAYDTVSVYLKKGCDVSYILPDIFTPNGDGVNDLLQPVEVKAIDNATITIYSRWGKKVFETNDIYINWTGADATDGTYYYQVVYEDAAGVISSQKGYIQIER